MREHVLVSDGSRAGPEHQLASHSMGRKLLVFVSVDTPRFLSISQHSRCSLSKAPAKVFGLYPQEVGHCDSLGASSRGLEVGPSDIESDSLACCPKGPKFKNRGNRFFSKSAS